MGSKGITMQDVFEAGFEAYSAARRVTPGAYRAAHAIMACRTEAMGGQVQRCAQGHEERVQYHSCKHRSCPRCAALPRAAWARAEQARLLECAHFHVVFTLPHELLGLWQANRRWFADALFGAVRDTLLEVLGDGRHLGARPGILLALHTWGRTLNLHPHVHCLVSAGGLDRCGQWKEVRNGYLAPVAVLEALYKGKLLGRLWSALERGALRLPGGAAVRRTLKAVGRKRWNVRVQERYAHGRGVMLYLARYVKGGPISDGRLVAMDDAQVVMRYTDHRDGASKCLALARERFIERVLWHVPEHGQHGIRRCGLYAQRAGAERAQCRAQLIGPMPAEEPEVLDWRAYLERLGHGARARCRRCGAPLLCVAKVPARRRGDRISGKKVSACAVVQQDVGAHRPGGVPPPLQADEAAGLSFLARQQNLWVNSGSGRAPSA